MKKSKQADTFTTRAELKTERGSFVYYNLNALSERGIADIGRLPFSIKIILEALLRSEDAVSITAEDILRLARYNPKSPEPFEIPFKPGRVLLQDFTGVPCVVDLAAMRSAMQHLGGDPARINPRIPVDLVVDHSVQVDAYNRPDALEKNTCLEFERNRERYELFRWAQQAFSNLRVIPPATGICHQVNLEYLATVVSRRDSDGDQVLFPDTLVGTDSHTTMINGLGVAGWGVGGIEAEAVMLGEPLYMTAPPVVGFRLTGQLQEGVTATDLVLTITQLLRGRGVVGKIVEFFGQGLSAISVPDRATVANMAPEYGATMGYFPVDERTLDFLRSTGRPDEHVTLVQKYCLAQGLFRTDTTPDPAFQETIELDLAAIKPCLAGPSRPQDRIELSEMKTSWQQSLTGPVAARGFNVDESELKKHSRVTLDDGTGFDLRHGSVVIASITSCTNTSNPSVMLAAGLLAKKAVAAGLATKPWVKTSLAPGSIAVTGYLKAAGLLPYLEKLGFYVVGYGCATCIGNSGALPAQIETAIDKSKLVAAAVVSGNRNFEGRINPHVRANFLASPPLVVACGLSGSVDIDFAAEPLGHTPEGKPVFLKDIWPTSDEINALMDRALDPELFRKTYTGIEQTNKQWNEIPVAPGMLFNWQKASSYIQEPPYFSGMAIEPGRITPITGARVLVMVGSSITTDHISPAGSIRADSPAGRYLIEHGVQPPDFNSYGSRRGNHEVMVRGTFANIRLKNQLAPSTEGCFTTHLPDGEVMSIYDAALKYQKDSIPTIVLAGRDYGMGSSRDWAAKGTQLLGVRAVIAESFERIHRSNLSGMGVLPLQFKDGQNSRSLGLTGKETYTIMIDDSLKPGQEVTVEVIGDDGRTKKISAICRLDTRTDIDYYRNGGILPRVLRMFRG
jgi:aconitate hydratase